MQLILCFSTKGVQEPEYRSWLLQELAFFNRSRSRIRSGYFWLEQEQEWFLSECFKDLNTHCSLHKL